MKVEYTTSNGKLKVQTEGNTQKEVFKNLADFQEVFEETRCGKCRAESLKFVVRTVDNNDFYELRCRECNARLQFGQHKTGGSLFPKRKDSDGNWLNDKGWEVWQRPPS